MSAIYGKRCGCGVELSMVVKGMPGERDMADEIDRQAREHAKVCKDKQTTQGKRPG